MATSSDKVDFSRLRYEIRKHWWWFIASFAAMMAIAAVYMLKNNPEFKFHADIMIEQEEGRNGRRNDADDEAVLDGLVRRRFGR